MTPTEALTAARDALKDIVSVDYVDAALDPQRALRIAREALRQIEEALAQPPKTAKSTREAMTEAAAASWKAQEAIRLVRLLERDHSPDGWPAVRMSTLSALADALEQRALGDDATPRQKFEAWLKTTPEWAPEFEQHRAWVEQFAFWAWQSGFAEAAGDAEDAERVRSLDFSSFDRRMDELVERYGPDEVASAIRRRLAAIDTARKTGEAG